MSEHINFPESTGTWIFIWIYNTNYRGICIYQHAIKKLIVLYTDDNIISKFTWKKKMYYFGCLYIFIYTLQVDLPSAEKVPLWSWSVQSVLITTKFVSLKPAHGEVYLIQHYVINFVSGLLKVSDFLWFPPPTKLTATIYRKWI